MPTKVSYTNAYVILRSLELNSVTNAIFNFQSQVGAIPVFSSKSLRRRANARNVSTFTLRWNLIIPIFRIMFGRSWRWPDLPHLSPASQCFFFSPYVYEYAVRFRAYIYGLCWAHEMHQHVGDIRCIELYRQTKATPCKTEVKSASKGIERGGRQFEQDFTDRKHPALEVLFFFLFR